MAKANEFREPFKQRFDGETGEDFTVFWAAGEPRFISGSESARAVFDFSINPDAEQLLKQAIANDGGEQESAHLTLQLANGTVSIRYNAYRIEKNVILWQGTLDDKAADSKRGLLPPNTGPMVWLTDLNGEIVYKNEAFCRVTDSRLHTHSVEDFTTTVKRIFTKGQKGVARVNIPDETRPDYWTFDVAYCPDRSPAGTGGFEWFAAFPTTPEAVTLTPETLDIQWIANQMPEYVVFHTPDLRLLFINKMVEEFYGTPLEALPISARMPTKDAPSRDFEYGGALKRLLQTGQAITEDFIFPRPKGVREIHTVIMLPQKASDGSIYGAVSFGQKATITPSAVKGIAQSYSRLNGILNTFPDLIWMKDLEGRLIFCNTAFELLLDQPPGTLIGKRFMNNLSEDIHSAIEENDRAAIESGKVESYEVEFQTGQNPARTLKIYKLYIPGTVDDQSCFLGIARELTLERSLKASAEIEERRFKMLTEASPDNIIIYDKDGCIVYINKQAEQALSLSLDKLIGRNVIPFLKATPHMRELGEKIEAALKTGQDQEVFMEVTEDTIHHVKVRAEKDSAGAVTSVFATGRDITEAQRTKAELLKKDEALDDARQRLSSVISALPDMVWLIDCGGVFRLCNAAFESFTGYSQIALCGHKWPFHEQKLPTFVVESGNKSSTGNNASGTREVQTLHPKTGVAVHLEIQTIAVRNSRGETTGNVSIARDITTRKNLELELKASKNELVLQANSDPLTGLPNRRHYGEKIQEVLEQSAKTGKSGALLLIDLDRFSVINDSVGHTSGDILLSEMARRMRSVAEANDGYIARLNGDEFVLILPDVDGIDETSIVAERLLTSISKAFFNENRVLTISGSVGITFFPEHSTQPEELLSYADNAMYEAKNGGRNTWRVFDQSLIFRARERFELEADIRKGLEAEQFSSHYQAKIDLKTGEIMGVEALMRWSHPERGTIPPAIFIPLAEETGLILPLGEKILTDACHFARAWNESSRPPIRVAVNLSPRQILYEDFVPLVRSCLSRTGCRPEWIELEITENILLSDEQRVTTMMHDLVSMGIKITIDDFGTGYSAMSYLLRYPISTLKIDRSFVIGVTEDSKKAALVKAIITMAEGLGMNTVGEGIETHEQAIFMRNIGCKEGQGFLWNRPMSRKNFKQWADQQLEKRAAE